MQVEQIMSKLSDKIIRGDFITLGKCLNISSNTATKRYKNKNIKAVLVMETIIKSRENIIKKIQKELKK